MLTRKDWQPEWVLRLVVGLFACILLGGAAVEPLATAISGKLQQEHALWRIVLAGFAFHGGAVPLIIWFVRRHGKSWRTAFGWDDDKPLRAIVRGAGTGMAMLVVGYGLLTVISSVLEKLGYRPESQEQIKLLIKTSSPWIRAYLFIVAVCAAPIVEELFFRGILFPAIRDLGFPKLARYGTALLFGIMHGNLAAVIPLTFVGWVLAMLYERSGSILCPIVAHVVFNLAPFVLLGLGMEVEV